MKLKKGDKVVVIAGKDKGKVGVIQRAYPKLNKVVVEGVNIHKKHQKPTQQNPNGSIVEMYSPIDVSNVMYYDNKTKKGTRIGYKFDKDGNKVRYQKINDSIIK
ncbi:MAG: 50S ribosomal protein L24 [Firmicutes bacterium]|uniref:Large ribosomal subunit protein uL24 n=1 Tax=Candidatus Onthovivens merdipullorum TaxID=2840889 RepID=A0A9D9DMC6_9BACL|nr:50S ribosomal protein L24 [Candidatus Onthovivens merdipullorum]